MTDHEPNQVRTFNHRGWGFTRLDDQRGAVRITTPMHGFQLSMEPETWASIVASTCAGGETNANWRAALAFHQDAHVHGEPTHIRVARDQVILAIQAWEQARAAMTDAYENRDTTIRSDMAVHRAMVACYDAEERLIDLRAILTGLEDKYAARRSQPQPPEEEEQRDPGDEHHGAGDTSPVPAHSPAQMLGSAVTATNATDALRTAPAAYVPPPGTTRTLDSVTRLAPAALTQLGIFTASGPTVPELQGWFTRHGDFAMRYARFEDAWYLTFEHSIPTQQCAASAGYLLNALVALANAVLQQAGYTGKLSERL